MSWISVPQWPSDISGNDWCGLVNSSPAADRMSDAHFGVNPVFWAENWVVGKSPSRTVQDLTYDCDRS